MRPRAERFCSTPANINEIIRIAEEASHKGVKLLVFPELSITGYTCADLFVNDVLLSSAKAALTDFITRANTADMISIIGLPLLVNDKIYNCAAICQSKQILGIVPKTNLPNYAEFSEVRTFASDKDGKVIYIDLCDTKIPFGSKMIFRCADMPEFRLGVEICEDILISAPPSTLLASAGATVIANLSASTETVGKAEHRRLMVRSAAARNLCGYLYANCFVGESTTDVVFSGHSMIAEGSHIIAEKAPFDYNASQLLITELDLGKLMFDRRKINTVPASHSNDVLYVNFSLDITDTVLTRQIDSAPFIPEDENECRTRCETILTIQAQGLAQRITRAYAKNCVIGISGGLDSCLALLVAVRAMDILKRPRADVLCVTMPCFGTTTRTRSNAEILCNALGVEFRCVDISNSVRAHLRDIGHDESIKNVVYENAQARERTQVIMDIANMTGGIVVGTGDLSELALGFATYNGDHMSMYGVNACVPKTLVRHIVSHCADDADSNGQSELASVLRDIVNTPVSPELLPANANGDIAQHTEEIVGPYEIHDFYLYHMLRYGSAPDKLYRIAKHAFAGVYDDATLLKWLKIFVRRFFSQQFKRSCLPDGPKVGSVGVSPRGDLKMPSDASSAEWLKMIDSLE